jgi:hypothetical protein
MKRPLDDDVVVLDTPHKKLKNDISTTAHKPMQTNLHKPTIPPPTTTNKTVSTTSLSASSNIALNNSSELTKPKKSYNPGKRQTIMLTAIPPTSKR